MRPARLVEAGRSCARAVRRADACPRRCRCKFVCQPRSLDHTSQTFARATAAAGVRSTLTLPILEDGTVIGTVNLYGRTDTTFDGKHALLATVFDGWAPGAVTNADLSFTTRRSAEEAP